MFTTQFTPTKHTPEPNSGISLVSDVKVKPNSVKILDAIMAGSMIEARNIGYDYQAGDKLPDLISAYNTRSMDIVDRLEIVSDVRRCIEGFINKSAQTKINQLEQAKQEEKPVSTAKTEETAGN